MAKYEFLSPGAVWSMPMVTLRDQFAMAALPFLLDSDDDYEGVAISAYTIADAMLRAREQEGAK